MTQMSINFQKLAIVLFVFSLSAACTANSFHDNLEVIRDYAIDSYDSKAPAPRRLRVATNAVRIQNNVAKISLNVTESPRQSTVKKWQVGRVSHKHYEIINMLWRKTNIFVDVENTSKGNEVDGITTHKMRARRKSTTPLIIPQHYIFDPFKISKPSTSSYIEFYYMDETVDNIKDPPKPERHLESKVNKTKEALNKHLDKFRSFSRSPFFAFHVNDPASALKRGSHIISHKKPISYAIPPKNIEKAMMKVSNFHTENLLLQSPVTKNFLNISLPVKNNIIENGTAFTIKLPIHVKNITTTRNTNDKHIIVEENYSKALSHEIESTTAYDRIKFFEVYDSDTYNPLNVTSKGLHSDDDNHNAFEENGIDRYQKGLLEHLVQGIELHNSLPKMRFLINKNIEMASNRTSTHIEIVKNNVTEQKSKNQTTENFEPKLHKIFKLKRENILNIDLKPNMSRLADWSEYPFVAVYVYERYQVHCDAAVISPHWLVASGSCLSRHSERPGGDGRSAFVTYCGDSWWNPERIAYVKYSVVHPRFHPHDMSRRYLFNIGVIKVVSSMNTACTNWEPVSIMSHQFAATGEGSIASAVGWGLDRYDTKYTSTDLPRRPLTVYEGLVFSDSCPGNSIYRKSTFVHEEGTTNVYCLALPPYTEEEKDPVHGGLLLVGGKLIALYLQLRLAVDHSFVNMEKSFPVGTVVFTEEERRQWGDQSAQYTGIWKLVPWMLNVAHEQEEPDFIL